MNIVEEQCSPDGWLRLIVTRDDDGDIVIGFDGFPWLTHGDILASLSGLPEKEAVRRFVDRVVGGGQVIAVSRVNGEVREIWPTDDQSGEYKYKPADESLEFRHWSGELVSIQPPNPRRHHPPAIAPTIQYGSAPVATGSGTGASGGSKDKSDSQA